MCQCYDAFDNPTHEHQAICVLDECFCVFDACPYGRLVIIALHCSSTTVPLHHIIYLVDCPPLPFAAPRDQATQSPATTIVMTTMIMVAKGLKTK